jgi:hypothetical protein
MKTICLLLIPAAVLTGAIALALALWSFGDATVRPTLHAGGMNSAQVQELLD